MENEPRRDIVRRVSEHDIDQLQLPLDLGDAAVEVRPEYNIGKYAGYIFASPYAKNLHEERRYTWLYTKGKESVEASLSVTPLLGSKTPTTTTLRVYYALIEAWEQLGRPDDGKLSFSARALANLIGWQWAGSKTAKMIEDHLDILKNTRIKYVWAYTNTEAVTESGGTLSIIDDETYVQRKDLFSDQKFSLMQRVRLNKEMIDNMISGHVRPVNHEAFKQISNDTAANLYTKLDLYLHSKPKWERRSLGLLTEELGLTGTRYQQRKHRHAKLKDLVKHLDGKALFYGTLRVTIEETADGTDWKLVARKEVKKRQIPPRVKKITDEAEASIIAADIIDIIKSNPKPGKPTVGFIEFLCQVYPRTLLYDALSMAKSDFRGNVKTTLTAVFVSEVRRLVKESKKYQWHKDE